jgi:co-chaperonin GroES (HSP10)
MGNWFDGYDLSGDHFKASIALPANHPSGIVLFNRDPRSAKKKPDAYAGVILDVSPGCEMVKIGDNVVFERWDWQQYDVDDEKIIARERDLVVVNDTPVPGYIIFRLEDLAEKKTEIIIPQTVDKPKHPTLAGIVVASGVKDILPGEGYIFEQYDQYQFYYGNGLMAFRVNRGADIIARYDREPVLEVI